MTRLAAGFDSIVLESNFHTNERPQRFIYFRFGCFVFFFLLIFVGVHICYMLECLIVVRTRVCGTHECVR